MQNNYYLSLSRHKRRQTIIRQTQTVLIWFLYHVLYYYSQTETTFNKILGTQLLLVQRFGNFYKERMLFSGFLQKSILKTNCVQFLLLGRHLHPSFVDISIYERNYLM